jgi:hypothetical protein
MQEYDVRKTQFAVADFVSWQRDKSIDLNPKFQRRSVWKPDAKSYFMDTVVKGLPAPITMHHRNAHVAVYPWPGLDIIRRRSQRRLLSSARRKLQSIPPSAYGLICVQTFSSKRFAPDIHRLLRQKEFERIPIVWLSPVGIGQVICRDDALLLRDQIFGAMLARAEKADQEAGS